MQVRPLKLLNDSERAFLASRVASALDEWHRAWLGRGAADASAECAPAADSSALAGTASWLGFTGAHGALYLADAARVRAGIVAALGGSAGDAAPVRGSIAADVTARALDDLARRIAGESVGGGEGAPPDDAWLPASGAAGIGWRSAATSIDVLIDQRLVAHLLAALPRPARRAAPLANPQLCLGRQPIEVRVWLGDAELELAQFQTLAVNDVIQLDSRIDEPLRITVGGRDVAPRGFLGRAGEQKAIRLSGT